MSYFIKFVQYMCTHLQRVNHNREAHLPTDQEIDVEIGVQMYVFTIEYFI